MSSVKDRLERIRSSALAKSMIVSTLCKPIGLLISFLYTPAMLAYLGDETYGIWATILQIINWVNYFDVGIGQGLRNTLASYIAQKDEEKASHAVSTGYIALSVISGVVLLIGSIAILLVDTNWLFNTSVVVKPALFVSFFCICLNFVLGLVRSQLYATQHAERVSIMTVMTHLVNLIGVYILAAVSQSRLIYIALLVGLSGLIVNFLYSYKLWNEYRFLIPRISYYRREELTGICGIGIRFFFIQIAAMILYSTDTMIITRLFGPTFVTPYSTSYTAFGVVNGIFAAMMAPLWSKYTVSMKEGDFKWIKKSILRLDAFLPIVVMILTLGVLFFRPAARIWLHKDLAYERGLIPGMAVYFLLQIWGSIYATVLNGMGHVNLQLILGVGSAVINIPLSIFLGKNCGLGTTGVLLATIICMAVTNIVVTIHTHNFLNEQILSTQI